MSLPTTNEKFCPRCKVDFELPIEANYCPTCGSLLQKIEEKKDKYQIVLHWLLNEFYNVADEKFNPRDQVLEILQNEAQCAVDKYLISGRAAIQIKYVKNVNSMGTPIHLGSLDLSFDRKRWYALCHPEKTADTCWEYVKSCGYGQVKRFQRKYALVDYDDVVILPCEYDDIQELPSGFVKFRKDGKYGLLNIKSSYSSENNGPKITMLADCQYDFVFDFKHGYAKVQKSGEWYLINQQGVVKMKQCHSNASQPIWLPIQICDNILETTKLCLQKLAINNVVLGSTIVSDIDCLEERNSLLLKDSTGIEHNTHDVFMMKNSKEVSYGTIKDESIITYCLFNNASREYVEIKPKIELLINNEILKEASDGQDIHIYESDDSILRIVVSKGVIIMEVKYTENSFVDILLSTFLKK